MIDAGFDEARYALGAVFHRPACGPDFDSFSRKIFLIVTVEESFGFAERLITIAIHGHATLSIIAAGVLAPAATADAAGKKASGYPTVKKITPMSVSIGVVIHPSA